MSTGGLKSSPLLANVITSKDSMVNLYRIVSYSDITFKQGYLGIAVEFVVVTECSSSALGDLGPRCPSHLGSSLRSLNGRFSTALTEVTKKSYLLVLLV